MEYTHLYSSPLGSILLSSDGKALSGLWFYGQRYFALSLSKESKECNLPIFDKTAQWLNVYFGGENPSFTPPLAIKGTAFQKMVWDILLAIPYGKVMTYGDIARIIAKRKGLNKMAFQAVGGAVGHNAISLIIPCHRVIGSDGNLTGYGGGIDRKIKLLSMEGVDMSRLFAPKNTGGATKP